MERFTRSLTNLRHGEELSRAIHRGGAFRKFKIAVRRLGIEDEWFRFRQSALEEIAKDWLEDQGVQVN